MCAARNVNFANFICRFGDKAVMLDYGEEIVIPAFRSSEIRTYAKGSFFFTEVNVQNFGTSEEPELVIAGRFIQDTVVQREQRLKNGVLIKDPASMPSAPSAIFALDMGTHKLIYCPETRGAPSLQAFRATSAVVLGKAYKNYIAKCYEAEKTAGRKVTKKALMKELPMPTVEVIPLSNQGGMADFLNQFTVLQRVSIKLVDPNDELDTPQLVRAMRKTGESLHAKNAVVTYVNKDGMPRDIATHELGEAIAEGNTEVFVSGKDAAGDAIKGNNDSFKVGVPLDEISEKPDKAAKTLHTLFKTKVSEGIFKVSAVGEKALAKMKSIAISIGAI